LKIILDFCCLPLKLKKILLIFFLSNKAGIEHYDFCFFGISPVIICR